MTTQQKKAKLRRRADRLLQEVGRKMYKYCLVCGKPMSCLHHYYAKSTASVLRYDFENLIPICQGCHLQLHTGNPAIQNRINEVKGSEWLEQLETKKRNGFIKTNLAYYENIVKQLEKL